jgi:hypothetical protein
LRRTISSSRTRLLKISACLWIAVLAIVTLTLFCISYGFPNLAGTALDASLAWKFLIATAILAVFVYFYYVPLKDVAIEGTSLVIWTSGQTAVVPLEEIEAVWQTRWLSSLVVANFFRRVTIYFRHETVFGRSVMFVPELRTTEFLGREDPIVAELRRAAAAAVSSQDLASLAANREQKSQ